MRTKAQKWGNSLAVRIPKAVADQLGLEPEDELDLAVADNTITLAPRAPRLSLAALLEEINVDNVHTEVVFGERQGNEAW